MQPATTTVHYPTHNPQGFVYINHGGIDMWPQMRPRLKEFMQQFAHEPRTAEQACKSAQELVHRLNSPNELQHVLTELLYDIRRQHSQIRKMRFR